MGPPPAQDRSLHALVRLDAAGHLAVELPSLPTPLPGQGTVLARRRPDGPEVAAELTGAPAAARVVLPGGPQDRTTWDLFLDAGGRRRRLLAIDDRAGPLRVAQDCVVEPYRTVHGGLSLRVRRPRPRAEVGDLHLADGRLAVRILLHELDGPVAEPAVLVARSRHADGEVLVPAELVPGAPDAGGASASLVLDRLVTATGLRHHTVDLHLRVQGAAGVQDLRLRCAADADLPGVRLDPGGEALDVQAYRTAGGYLSLRLGAGVPPGVGIVPGARPRRPAPAPVRRLVTAWLGALERRAAAGRTSRPALGTDRPRVHFLLRSAYGYGGTIRTVLTTANHLAEQGLPVEVISLVRLKDETFFPLSPRVRHTWLFDERTRYGVAATLLTSARPVRAVLGRALLGRLDRWESVLTHPREIAFGRSSLLTDVLLVRALQRLGPGVLVLTRPVLNVVGARFAPARLRTVGQEHMHLTRHPPELRAWMLAAYRRLDALTVLTSGDEQDYRAALVGSEVVLRRMPNGLPALPTAVSDQSARVVVAVGRLTRQKGFDLLVRAFAQVAAQHPDWSLRIFGDGTEKQALQRLVDELGLGEAVQLRGPTAQVEDELARGSLYALSSRYEGFGMVILEAMAAGLPVVSYDCPRGPADIITHGQDGLLVPPEDVPALAEALGSLIADDERRRAMAVAARATAERYLMEHVGLRWQDLLRELGTAR